MKILVIHGPNLNLLGSRKPDVYGHKTMQDVNSYLQDYFKKVKIDFYQSNTEGDIVDHIQSADSKYDGIALNAAAYSHYSIAIRDAIEAIAIPVVEVHISNIAAREEFRHKSVISEVVLGSISGLGIYSYVLALQGLAHHLTHKSG